MSPVERDEPANVSVRIVSEATVLVSLVLLAVIILIIIVRGKILGEGSAERRK